MNKIPVTGTQGRGPERLPRTLPAAEGNAARRAPFVNFKRPTPGKAPERSVLKS